ncbi:MAG TPA: serine/threonine-protein kinase [Pseudonocardiaceae bacterium]
MDTTSEPGFAGPEIPGYRLLGSMSRTPMSEVYRAQELAWPGRVVALKVLPTFGARPASADRFRREIRIAKELNHPNIVETYDSGETADHHYFAMRFVEGRDLGKLLIEDGPLPVDRAIDVGYQVAGALDVAHARRLVHRDVKPGNILIDDASGQVFLCDFGIAKDLLAPAITRDSPPFTPLYAAPEQQTGQVVDHRADVYALAGVLYAGLTGRAPFEDRAETREVLAAQRRAAPPRVTAQRPDLPAGVDDVLAIGLAKRPADRYDNCTDLVDDLVAVVHGGQRVRRRRPIRPLARGRVAILGAVVVVAAGVLAIVQPWQSSAAVDLGWVPAALRPSCAVGGSVPNAAATATCQVGATSVVLGQFSAENALTAAYGRAVSDSGVARDTGDCTAGSRSESRYPGTGTEVGRVVCSISNGATSSVVWTDTASRVLGRASAPVNDDATVRGEWAQWVGIAAFPTAAERDLVNLAGEQGCKRTAASTLDGYVGVLAALDCTPNGSGASAETYVRFGAIGNLRAAFDGDAGKAKEPSGVDCSQGKAPGFLGNQRFDLRSVFIGGLQCHPGLNSSLDLEWSVEPLLVLGKATGPDPVGLANWWQSNYGPPTGAIVAALNKQDSPPFPTARESALLAHIPAISRNNCIRPSADQARTNVGNYQVVGVVCGPTSGAPIIFYYQFADDTAMNASYGVPQENAYDCTTLPSAFDGEHAYNRGGQTGRLQCGSDDNSPNKDLVWTDDQLAIEAFAFQGHDPTAMIDWWRDDAGPV